MSRTRKEVVNKDSKNAPYAQEDSSKSKVTPVSYSGDNGNTEESYRRDNDTDFRPDFSNLKNTYMITTNGHNARERFWGKQYSVDHSYRNNNCDIEDPIFTGFTLSIDRHTSPLFYTIGNYNGVADGRYDEDGNSLSRNIADEIENSLQVSYGGRILSALNSYEIMAELVKDKFPDGKHEIGYGLQHNVYLDGIPYGALEYIYMVDKFVEGEDVMQDDKGGQYSLGDGESTQAATTYDTRKLEEINDSIETSKGQMDESSKIINDENVSSTHDQNINKLDNAKTNYNKTEDNITDLNELIESYTLDSESKLSAYKKAIQNELRNYVTNISNAFKRLKPDNGSNLRTEENYKKTDNDICYYANEIQKIINKCNTDMSYVKSLISGNKSVTVDSCNISINSFTDCSSKYKSLKIEGSDSTHDSSNAYNEGYKYSDMSYFNISLKITVKENEENIADCKNKLKQQEDNLKKQSKEIKTAQQNLMTDEYSVAYTQYESARSNYESKNIQKTQIEAVKYAEEQEVTRASDANLTIKGDTSSNAKIVGNANGTTKDRDIDGISAQDVNKKTVARVPQTVKDMAGFISGMIRLTEEYPYMLQSITGLDEVYKNNYVVKDSMRGSVDNKISISLYESLDLKISGMFNKYFNAVYDAQYRRERVPVNLRRFNCSIFVHDIRNFFLMTTQLGGKLRNLSKQNVAKIIEVALNSLSAIEFKFYGCEIVPEETGSIFDNVSNADMGEMRMTNFVFTYSDVVINYLPFSDLKKGAIGALQKYPNGPHKPSVSVDKGTNTELSKLKFPTSKKAYEYKNEGFDNAKPKLKSSISDETHKANTYDESAKTSINYDSTDSSLASIQGLGSHNTTPSGNGNLNREAVKNALTGGKEYVLDSPLGNVNKNDAYENKYESYSEFSNLPHNTGGMKPTNGKTLSNLKYTSPTSGNKVYDENISEFDAGLPKLDSTLGNYEDSVYVRKTKDSPSIDTTNNSVDKLSGAVSISGFGSNTKPVSTNLSDIRKKVNINYDSQKEPQLKSGLGNVNENDISESEKIKNENGLDTSVKSTTINAVKTGYRDRSPLGNVNNDDYDEYRNRKYDKDYNDRLVELKSNENLSNAELNANSSVKENIEQERKELDILFNQLATSIAASTGLTKENVYSSYLEEMHHIVYPEYNTETVDKIRYSSTYNTRDTRGELNTPGLAGISARTRYGKVSSLGDVDDNDNLEDIPEYNRTEPHIQGLSTSTANGYIDGLGDVLPDDLTGNNVSYIGDVIPDDPSVPNVDSIGNVYPTLDTPDTQGYIDDVIPDDPSVPNVDSIGNVYPTLDTPDTQGYIDDVIPDDVAKKPIKDISNVYPKVKDGDLVTYIDDVIPDDNNANILKKIDLLYDKVSKRPIIEDLGKIQ